MMIPSAFLLSYALLWLLVLFEALVLREALRETVWLIRLFTEFHFSEEKHLPPDTPAPAFSAPRLGTRGTVNSDQLRGYKTTLLFVSPADAHSPRYKHLSVHIHSLWHDFHEHLLLVCSGGAEACSDLVRRNHVAGFADNQLSVVLDEGGRIARSFMIGTTPQAVMLDEAMRVRRYGQPEVESEAVPERSNRNGL